MQMQYSGWVLVTCTVRVLPPGTMMESPGWLKPALPAFTSGVVGFFSSPVFGSMAP